MDTEQILNVYKAFKRCPGRLPNVLRMFDLRPLSKESFP